MRCLIIGYGSIGNRHAQVLKKLGCDVMLVTSQKVNEYPCFSNIVSALENTKVDYVVISNETYLHHAALLELIKCEFSGIVLVEKPVFAKPEILPANKIKKIVVGYNLRFYKPLIELKQLITQEKLLSFSAYVGQYLPTWRKNKDYRAGYSAKADCGGGVLRDLSHELDYSQWLCGRITDVAAIGGKFSDLDINSDDIYSILMRSEKCPILNIQLNYLDRATRRDILIQTNKMTAHLDLIKGIVRVNGEIKSESENATSETYLKQHEAVLSGDFSNFCSYEAGMEIVNLIAKIESANAAIKWERA